MFKGYPFRLVSRDTTRKTTSFWGPSCSDTNPYMAVGQKYENPGKWKNMDQNLRSPGGLILTHTHMCPSKTCLTPYTGKLQDRAAAMLAIPVLGLKKGNSSFLGRLKHSGRKPKASSAHSWLALPSTQHPPHNRKFGMQPEASPLQSLAGQRILHPALQSPNLGSCHLLRVCWWNGGKETNSSFGIEETKGQN